MNVPVSCGGVAAGGLAIARAAVAQAPAAAPESSPLEQLARRTTTTMSHPYRLVEAWPKLPDGMTWGAAIGIIPDDKGGAWMMFRSEPPINYIDASGAFTKSFARGLLVQGHGFCMDHDGHLWVGDSGPFMEDASVSEIMINGPHQIYIERKGKLELTDRRFASPAAVLAALRNATIALLRGAGWTNIAAAVRHHAWHPGAALAALGLSLP